jgi:hypothetical protein
MQGRACKATSTTYAPQIGQWLLHKLRNPEQAWVTVRARCVAHCKNAENSYPIPQMVEAAG